MSGPVRRRWLRILVIALSVALAIVVLAPLCLLAALDTAWGRRQVQAAAARAGVALEYDRLRVGPGGLVLSGLRVGSPQVDAALAPALLRGGSVEVTWRLWRPALRRVALRGLTLTVVMDENGETSVDRLLRAVTGPPAPPVPAPPVPRSRLLGQVLGGLPALSAEIIDVTLALVRRRGTTEVDRITLGPLRLRAELRPGGPASVELTGPDAGLVLARQDEHGTRRAQATLRLAARAEGEHAVVELALRLLQQDLIALPAGADLSHLQQAVDLAAEARFLPAEHRVQATLGRLDAGDGVLHLRAAAELPDEGPPLLTRAEGKLALGPLAPLLQHQAGVALDGGDLAFSAGGVLLSSPPALRPDGAAQLDAHLGSAALDAPALHIDKVVLHGEAHPGEGGSTRATLRLDLGALDLAAPGQHVAARGVRADLATRLDRAPPYQLDAHLDLARLAVSAGVGRRARELLPPSPARLDLEAAEVVPGDVPLRSRARVRAALALGRGEHLDLHLDLNPRPGVATYQLAARAAHLALVRPLLPPDLARAYQLPWERMGLALDSRGTVEHLGGPAPAIRHKTALRLLHPALKGGGRTVAADELALDLESQGNARRHQGTLDLRLAGMRLGGGRAQDERLSLRFAADRERPVLDLALRGEGGGPEGTLALRAELLPAGRALQFSASADLRRLGLVGALLPPGLRAQHRVDWSRLSLALHGGGTVHGLVRSYSPAGRVVLADKPMLAVTGSPELDLQVGELHYEGPGGLRVDLPALHLQAALAAEAGRHGATVTLDLPGRLAVDLNSGRPDARHLAAEGVHAEGKVDLGGPLAPWLADPLVGEGAGDLTLAAKARSLQDSSLAEGLRGYPLGDLALDVHLRKGAAGALRIDRFQLDNPRGGTHLALHGGVDLTARDAAPLPSAPEHHAGPHKAGRAREAAQRLQERLIYGRQSLDLGGSLSQDLGKLGPNAYAQGARGKVALDLQVQSGDLSLFHTVALLRLSGVSAAAPGTGGWAVRDADGRVPVVQDVRVRPGGAVELLHDTEPNAYPRLRFSDQFPFFSGDNYLSLAQARVGGVEMGPLVGKLRVDRNVFSIDQIDMALRGGQVRGRLIVNYHGPDSTLEFDGGVTGVRPARDDNDRDRLDANAALTLGLRRRDLEGRAEIVRISRRHLLDLIDALDPDRESVGMNRIRLGLKFGYPDHVRLRFEQGFGALAVSLGGLTRAVRIDEVRNIALGPLIEKYLGPVIEASLGPLVAAPPTKEER